MTEPTEGEVARLKAWEEVQAIDRKAGLEPTLAPWLRRMNPEISRFGKPVMLVATLLLVAEAAGSARPVVLVILWAIIGLPVLMARDRAHARPTQPQPVPLLPDRDPLGLCPSEAQTLSQYEKEGCAEECECVECQETPEPLERTPEWLWRDLDRQIRASYQVPMHIMAGGTRRPPPPIPPPAAMEDPPPFSIGDIFEVSSKQAMVALPAQQGDIAMLPPLPGQEEPRCYVLMHHDPTVLADWLRLISPPNE